MAVFMFASHKSHRMDLYRCLFIAIMKYTVKLVWGKSTLVNSVQGNPRKKLLVFVTYDPFVTGKE